MSQNTLIAEVKKRLEKMKSNYFNDHLPTKKFSDYSWQDFLLAAWQRTGNMKQSEMMRVSGIKPLINHTPEDDIKHALKMALHYLKKHNLETTLQTEISETIEILEQKSYSIGKLAAAASQFETSHILSQMRTLIS